MKTIGKKTAGAGLFGVLVGTAVLVGPAFACTAIASLTSGSDSGAAGSSLPLEGTQWNGPDAGGPIDIHWDGTGGPLLASVPAQSSFKVTVNVPAAAAVGVYYVSAIQHAKADNAVAWARSVVYEVTAPPAVNQPPAPNQPPAAVNQPPGAVNQPPGAVNQAPAAVNQPPAAANQAPAANQPPAVGNQPSAVVNQPGRSTAGAAQPSTGSAPAGNRTPFNQSPPTPGLAPSAGAGPGSHGGGAPSAVPGGDAAVPAGVAASPQLAPVPKPSDLWSGLQPGTAPSLIGPASGSGHVGGSPIGVGLLAVGVVALAGTAMVTGRRRLALARGRGVR